MDDFLRNLFNLTQQAGGRYHFHLLLPTAILTAMVSGVGCRSDLMIKWYLCILFHLCLVHLTPAQVKDRYAYSESFSMKEGLKHTVVGDIKTDRNDLLWIAVDGTLQLFDGDQFIDMSHLIHESNSNGAFGFENGKDVFLLKANILYKITAEQYTSTVAPSISLPAYSRRDPIPKIIYEDGDFLYISHPNDSLYQIDKKNLAHAQTYAFPHRPNVSYRWSSIYISPEPVTAIPYFDTNSIRCTFELNTGRTLIDPAGVKAWRGAMASGDTMLVLHDNKLNIYAGEKHLSITIPGSDAYTNGQHFLFSGRDSVYVSLKNGVFLFNLRTLTWVARMQRTEGLPFSEIGVRHMVLDESGHLYFATFNTGLVKMYPSNDGFQYIGIQDKKKYFIKCIRVSEKNNLVLAGTLQDGLLVFDTNGVLKHHIQYFPDTHSLKLISAIVKISDSRYILFADKVLNMIFHGDKYTLKELNDSERYRLSYYDNAVEDKKHQRYFVFNHRELIDIRPDDPVPVRITKQPNIGACISAQMIGDKYVVSGMDELRFYNQDLTHHSIRFNVPNFGYSRCLVPYPGGKFLVGTDQGIFILDTLNPNKVHTSIYNHIVYGILAGEKEGEYWFSTDYGLYRLDANLEYKRYSIESGLQESEFNTNSCFKTESGKMYFGGINGITAFYPAQIDKEEDKPMPYISSLSVNGKVRERYIAPGATPSYTLAYDENVIQLRLLGKGLRSPRSYNFQYMVKGLHEEWINLGRNMDIQLQLPPGRYTIYYHIAAGFEPQAQTHHELQLRIKPPFYKRWWFITFLSVVPLYLLFYIMNLRRKRLAMKLAYKEELEKELHEERMRISRELHDNIGAQMAIVKRSINFMIEQSDRITPEQSRSKMIALESISSQINQELRDTIWAVQNEQIDVAGFFTRLKTYVFQLVGPDSPLRVTYSHSGNLNTLLGPFTALNLHRICQETINNIIKHAEANEIKIVLASSSSTLKITITDNGKGYDMENVKEGYGLGNIRKRAEQIGAIVTFATAPGSGSSIEIEYTRPPLSTENKRIHG